MLVYQNIVKVPANISLLIACLRKVAWMSSQNAGQFVSSKGDIFMHLALSHPEKQRPAAMENLSVALETVITVLPFWWLQRRSLLGQDPVLDGQHTLKIL